MSAEILAKQNEFFQAMGKRADLALLSQATISKRQCLNFIQDVKEFCEQFVILNNATIIQMQGDITDDTIRNDATGEPAAAGDPDVNAGATPGLREENNRADLGGDAPSETGLQTGDAGSTGLHQGSRNGEDHLP